MYEQFWIDISRLKPHSGNSSQRKNQTQQCLNILDHHRAQQKVIAALSFVYSLTAEYCASV